MYVRLRLRPCTHMPVSGHAEISTSSESRSQRLDQTALTRCSTPTAPASADSTDAGVDRKSQCPTNAPAMATMASQRTFASSHMKKANPSANNAMVRANDPPSSAATPRRPWDEPPEACIPRYWQGEVVRCTHLPLSGWRQSARSCLSGQFTSPDHPEASAMVTTTEPAPSPRTHGQPTDRDRCAGACAEPTTDDERQREPWSPEPRRVVSACPGDCVGPDHAPETPEGQVIHDPMDRVGHRPHSPLPYSRPLEFQEAGFPSRW
jgi:hypothetical protein